MRKFCFVVFIAFITITGHTQSGVLRTYDFHKKPLMDQSADGIWKPFTVSWYDKVNDKYYFNIPLHTDSTYISAVGLPNFGDLKVPDLETKVKSLWYGDSLFFLFQRLDDIYVTGYNSNGTVDATVAEGLENRDASTLYFYLSCDSLRQDSIFDYSDSVAWLRFGWKSDDVEGKLPSGEIVHSLEDFHAEAIQWTDGPYSYAKIGLSIAELAPYMPHKIDSLFDTLKVAYFGFAMDVSENDKEVDNGLFGLQTRTYWPYDFGESALENVPDWGWLWFYRDTLIFTPINDSKVEIAAVYPNPVSEYLNITLFELEQGSFDIYDIMGRNIMSGRLTGRDNSLYIEEIEQGTYFIRITNSNGQNSTLKFIKLE
jgi:hypothetical protein